MTETNIRYWDARDTTLVRDVTQKDVLPASQTEHYFDTALLDLFGRGSSSKNSLYANDFFGYDLNSPAQIREASRYAKSTGMEKVLAAQLSSPLPMSTNDSTRSQSAYAGFDSMINLTVQLQLAKAQKAFDQLRGKATCCLND